LTPWELFSNLLLIMPECFEFRAYYRPTEKPVDVRIGGSKLSFGMIVQSPTTSAYPGKYVMFAFAAFCAVLAWRSLRSAIRAWTEQRNRAELRIAVKPDPKKSV